MADRELEVVVQVAGEDIFAGRLWSHRRGRTESQTFSYEDRYIQRQEAYELDPALPFQTGQQQTAQGREIFGAFSDSAPDGWGRRLMKRSERRRSSESGLAERSLGEIDCLLGVRDDLRQGALRFRDRGTSSYLANEAAGIPALIDLPRLLNATIHLENDEEDDDDLQVLFRGGSSLGGARPKAHVLDDKGRLAIAKLPSVKDEWDVMRWEAVALSLAEASGISVPSFSVHSVEGRSVLIVDRFDREGEIRIGYCSAMTMLEMSDGARGSYLEIADVIERSSPRAKEDLRELWRRMAFSTLISNFDDHLRNHGFLRTTSAGWGLSPAFDLNPDPRAGPRELSTTIDFSSAEANVGLLLEVAPYFSLDRSEALGQLARVSTATSRWREVARQLRIGAPEIERMSRAFEHEASRKARDLA